jgi:NAD-dependent deacetylase
MSFDSRNLSLAAEWIRSAGELLVFTGAGVSVESGIPTFRDDDGFWQTFPPEKFATWRGIVDTAVRSPKQLAAFVHAVVGPIAAAQPNAAHRAIADAEEHVRTVVVTQNIDRLHQDAGSTYVHEIHGTFFETVSQNGRFHSLVSKRELQQIATRLASAERGFFTRTRIARAVRPILGLTRAGFYRPKLVLFGDAMAEPDWTKAQEAAQRCDVFLQIGCSGVVMPAAGLPLEARAHGAKIIAVDRSPVHADAWISGRAADVVPRLFAEAFGGKEPD